MIGSGIALSFWLFVSFVAVVFFFKRWRWRRNKVRGKRYLGYYPNAATLGNALHILQALTQPHVEHTLEQKLAEPTDDEDDAGPDDPTAHLHRQAQQIREGNPPERITAILPNSRRRKQR